MYNLRLPFAFHMILKDCERVGMIKPLGHTKISSRKLIKKEDAIQMKNFAEMGKCHHQDKIEIVKRGDK